MRAAEKIRKAWGYEKSVLIQKDHDGWHAYPFGENPEFLGATVDHALERAKWADEAEYMDRAAHGPDGTY